MKKFVRWIAVCMAVAAASGCATMERDTVYDHLPQTRPADLADQSSAVAVVRAWPW